MMNRFYKTFSGMIAAVVLTAFAAESCFAGVNVFTADNHILQASEFSDVIIKDIIEEPFDMPEQDAQDFEQAVPAPADMPESIDDEPAAAMPALLTIDSPATSAVVGNTLNISGWALYSADGYTNNISRIEIQVDGKMLADPARGSRADLAGVYPGYGDYSQAGFSMSLDISSYTNGAHTLFVRVWSSNFNALTTRTVTFYKQAQAGKPLVYHIDYPTSYQLTTVPSVYVTGWALYTSDGSTNGISRVDFAIDNKVIAGNADLYERPDLPAHFPGYPNYGNAGFSKTLSLSEVAYGFHTVTIRIWSVSGQLLDSSSITINYQNENYKPLKWYIDAPKADQVVYNSVNIMGWALFSEDGIVNGIKGIELFVDGIAVGEPEYFLRSDLIGVLPDYPDYSKSGFSKTINMDGFKLGYHTITGNILDLNGNTIGVLSAPFKLQSNIPRPFIGWFDTPTELETVQNTLSISGWALCTNNGSTSEISVAEIFIDGMSQGIAANYPRPDLEDVKEGYGDYSRAGFKLDLSTTGMSYGMHTITARFYNNMHALVGTINRSFYVVSQYAKPFAGHIDTPTFMQNLDTSLSVAGWALYTNDGINNSIRRMDIYIDDTNYGEPAYFARPDLVTHLPDYGDYSRSGFNRSIDISALAIGEHTLTIKVYDFNNVHIGELTTKFVRNPNLGKPFIAYFDYPTNGQIVNGKVLVGGWGLYTPDGVNSGINHVQILLDGESRGYATHSSRPDLYTARPGYGDYSKAGFYAEVDTTGLISGIHTITANFFNDQFNVVGQITTEIYVQPTNVRPLIAYIDTPTEKMEVEYGATLNVQGWAIYSIDGVNSAVSRVEVIVDSVTVADAALFPRADVGGLFPDYGDYSKAGFNASISTAGLGRGDHQLSIRVWSTSNQALGVITRVFTVK